jgi:hypothetical protein
MKVGIIFCRVTCAFVTITGIQLVSILYFKSIEKKFLSQGVNIRHDWKPFVPLEGKSLLIALVIVRITLNVIVRQMPLYLR